MPKKLSVILRRLLWLVILAAWGVMCMVAAQRHLPRWLAEFDFQGDAVPIDPNIP